jgi:hypothetical protein
MIMCYCLQKANGYAEGPQRSYLLSSHRRWRGENLQSLHWPMSQGNPDKNITIKLHVMLYKPGHPSALKFLAVNAPNLLSTWDKGFIFSEIFFPWHNLSNRLLFNRDVQFYSMCIFLPKSLRLHQHSERVDTCANLSWLNLGDSEKNIHSE